MAVGALTTCRKKNIQRGFRRRVTACKSKAPQGITLKKTNFQQDEIGETVPSIGCKKRENKQGCKRSRDVISECGSIEDYDILNMINHGSYGIVYRVRNKKSGEIVAMKEEFQGLSAESLREIDILRSLNSHPCIVDLKEVVVDDYDGVYIIMEYLENDLKMYMESRIDSCFSVGEVKLLMKQLIEGVQYLHENQVMHRDLKPSNLLINNVGGLKICDFGLSTHFGAKSGSYSSNVVTLWYRAPEVLMGSSWYSCAIDMWSVGCIMAELLLKEVLFAGESEIDQLNKIFGVLGTPNEGVWPGFGSLAGGLPKFVQQPDNLLGRKFSEFKEGAGFDLLNRLLTYDPDKRITAESALDHAWFKEC